MKSSLGNIQCNRDENRIVVIDIMMTEEVGVEVDMPVRPLTVNTCLVSWHRKNEIIETQQLMQRMHTITITMTNVDRLEVTRHLIVEHLRMHNQYPLEMILFTIILHLPSINEESLMIV